MLDAELLEPAFLLRLEGLVRLARRAPPPRPLRRRRFLSRGKGIEAAGHREYVPGDDLRSLDWAAYARLERLYVRLVEEVVEPRLDVVLDASGSMGQGLPAPIARARRVAAAVAAVALARGSRVAVWGLSAGRVVGSAPVRGAGRLVSVLRFLAGLEARGGPGLEAGVERIARASRLRGGVLLLSDLIDPDDAANALGRLRREGFDALAVELAVADEIDPEAAAAAARAGAAVLVDSETGAVRPVPFAPALLEGAARERAARAALVARRVSARGLTPARLAPGRPEEEIALALLEGDGARAAAARLARERGTSLGSEERGLPSP